MGYAHFPAISIDALVEMWERNESPAWIYTDFTVSDKLELTFYDELLLAEMRITA